MYMNLWEQIHLQIILKFKYIKNRNLGCFILASESNMFLHIYRKKNKIKDPQQQPEPTFVPCGASDPRSKQEVRGLLF